MATTLKVDDTDARLEFGPAGAWSPGPTASWNKDGTYQVSTTGNARFYILFRGTGIKLYGHAGPGGAALWLRFDGLGLQGRSWEIIDFSDTQAHTGHTPIFEVSGLSDGDHELLGWARGNGTANSAWVDYVELENLAGTSFEPQTSGSKALSISPGASVVDNKDVAIAYSGVWTADGDVQYYDSSLTGTNRPGDSFTYTFTGTGIWLYTDFDETHGTAKITIDDGSPTLASSATGTGKGQVSRRLLYANPSLADGEHTLRFEHADDASKRVSIDFIRVLAGNGTTVGNAGISTRGLTLLPASTGTSTSTSTIGTNDQGITSDLHSERPKPKWMPAVYTAAALGAIGILFGIWCLAVRRRRRRSASSSATPSTPQTRFFASSSQQITEPTPYPSDINSHTTRATTPFSFSNASNFSGPSGSSQSQPPHQQYPSIPPVHSPVRQPSYQAPPPMPPRSEAGSMSTDHPERLRSPPPPFGAHLQDNEYRGVPRELG